MTEKSKKNVLFFAEIFLVVSTAVYPFFMVIMTGTGLVCNYQSYGEKIMYTGIFLIVSGILMTAGSICCLFRKKIFSVISAVTWTIGFSVCMVMLYRLCVHADYNGWYRDLSPVSNMYKSRIFPVAVPFLTDLTISAVKSCNGKP